MINKDKLLDFFSKMSFTCLVTAWLLGAIGVFALIWSLVAERIALDKPTWEDGRKNSLPLIDALEKYKAAHGSYPQDPHDTHEYYPEVFEHLHDYQYETYSADGNPPEFMLSFRKRWTISSWYCYYSGDRKWLQSASTCWSDPRPINESDERLIY
jgi:hypothetical protein